ncbi:MAG: hemolysin III family protein [Candidatus Zambryskibacteria bacterium]|nr:hemolysin III family protein [Candidatus Zambryskibacteria bacterium]
MKMNTSNLSHLIATILSIVGLSSLVTLAAIKATTIYVVAFSVFGAGLILLYLASTIYHFIPHEHPRKDFFKILDRSMIYVLIAGSYTPLALLVLPPAWGWSIFGTIWGLAVIGISLKIFRVRTPRWLPTFMYLLMGWLIVIALAPLRALLPATGMFWLVAGGIFYTIGTIFFAISSHKNYQPRYKWFTFHDAFHVLAMGGSISHFWLMFHFILPG